MALHVFDTFRGEKFTFETREPEKVRMHVCGFTPYVLSHLGHARLYVTWDLVYRYLIFLNFDVSYVRYYLHLKDDNSDESSELGVDRQEPEHNHREVFNKDMDSLGVARPQSESQVNLHLNSITQLIQRLIDQGEAYEVDGAVFYQASKMPDPQKLGLDNFEPFATGEHADAGVRKREPMDFTLWRSSHPGEKKWLSPWGEGRPGWHLESSLSATSSLDEHLDLHCGGWDLVFSDSKNELVDFENTNHRTQARHWMHNGFTRVQNDKNLESLDKSLSFREVSAQYTHLVLRYVLMTATHYRKPLHINHALLANASARVAYFYETLRKVDTLIEGFFDEYEGPLPFEDLIKSFPQSFRDAMDDDFSIEQAMGLIGELFRALNELVDSRKPSRRRAAAAAAHRLRMELKRVDNVLNLFSLNVSDYLIEHRTKAVQRCGLSEGWIQAQISSRIAARTARDWAQADKIRDELDRSGVVLMDHDGGTDWSIYEGSDSLRGELE